MRQLALTIRQPWAFAIFEEGKSVENRSWKTDYRGRLWIHTSALSFKLDGSSIKAEEFRTSLAFIGCHGLSKSDYAFFDTTQGSKAFSSIIGSVDLVSCIPPHQPPVNEWHMRGSYGWRIANPVLLERPIPAKGSLGLWDCTKYLLHGGIELCR